MSQGDSTARHRRLRGALAGGPRSNLLGYGVLAAALLAVPALACNVPVFRYALEKWRVQFEDEVYRAIVFHRGPLDEKTQAQVVWLEERSLVGPKPANLSVVAVDVEDDLPKAVASLWTRVQQEQGDKLTLPWVVVCYPEVDLEQPPAWSGPLAPEPLTELLDSPARKEVARRLLAGQSAVWLLLESGQKERDQKAAQLLAEQLPLLEKNMPLPDLTDDPADRVSLALPLAVKFSVVKVSADDPREAVLRQLLLSSEQDLKRLEGPVVFPIFGRGRVLAALPEKHLDADLLLDAATFLCGPCSCQVKQQNPGFDLLMAVAWDAELEKFQTGSDLVPSLVPGVETATPSLEPRPAAVARLVPIPGAAADVAPGALPHDPPLRELPGSGSSAASSAADEAAEGHARESPRLLEVASLPRPAVALDSLPMAPEYSASAAADQAAGLPASGLSPTEQVSQSARPLALLAVALLMLLVTWTGTGLLEPRHFTT